MSKVTLSKKNEVFEQRMRDILDRAGSAKGGFARIYALYQRFQTERFATENASEGDVWEPLNPEYAKYKPRRYGGGPRNKRGKRSAGVWKSYPGAGTKMLIGTSTLAGAIIGPGAPFEGVGKHRAVFTDESMIIRVEMGGKNADGDNFDYAGFVSEKRPFMEFSEDSILEMKVAFSQFIVGF